MNMQLTVIYCKVIPQYVNNSVRCNPGKGGHIIYSSVKYP